MAGSEIMDENCGRSRDALTYTAGKGHDGARVFSAGSSARWRLKNPAHDPIPTTLLTISIAASASSLFLARLAASSASLIISVRLRSNRSIATKGDSSKPRPFPLMDSTEHVTILCRGWLLWIHSRSARSALGTVWMQSLGQHATAVSRSSSLSAHCVSTLAR